MTNHVIPAEAVEAAARALSIHTMVDDSPENEKFREAVRNEARAALEAAAPYLTRAAQERAWDEGDYANYKDRNPYRKSPDA